MEEKPETGDNIESNNDNNLAKKKVIPTAFTKFFNNFNFLLSIWITIMLMISFEKYLPELNWPWYLDKVLIFIFFFALLFKTIDFLKPLIISALVLGTIVITAYFVYSKEKNPSALLTSPARININLSADMDSLRNDMDSIKRDALFRDSTLKLQIDTLKEELDSLKKIALSKVSESAAVKTKSNKNKGQN
tara:strand:+ start:141 stop:713 length:573 start_codon:yes stop_codon:yes gene_type:complete